MKSSQLSDRKRQIRGVSVGIFLLIILLVAGWHLSAMAQTAAIQQLHGHVPAVVPGLKATGRLSSTTNLQLAISLPLRNLDGLSNLLHQIYDPASPNYHHYLTPAQFAEQFGPTEADYQAVIAFAQANGLHVTATHPNRVLLDVNGSVAEVEKALHVVLRVYQHPTENRTFYAPDTEPSLDSSVPILHISGLDNYALPRPHLQATRLVRGEPVSPNAGSGPSGTYAGLDFRAAYVPDSPLNGSGQVVGLLQFDGYTPSDITYYESKAGLQSIPLQNVLIDGASGSPSGSGGEVEVSLDIEMAISMATNVSKVIVYEAPNPSPFVDLLNRMATDNLAKQLSCSWYVPGGAAEPAADLIFQQMAVQGQSFFSASGDDDAYTGLINFPGDTPYITEVGGTTLTTSGPGGARVSETVWNRGNGIGSGGGISTQYPIPTWQTNISMAANQGSTTKRNVPDVAMIAESVYVRADGLDYDVGGTSCAAPLWAGLAALINQQAASTGQSAIGFINPALDAIGTGANYATALHDITTGNNTSSSSPNKFYAAAGYDLCTGWGTPAGQNLINALANPEPLLITPMTGFSSIGGADGPFAVSSQTFSVTNSGTNVLTWNLSNTSVWLNVSSSGGTLLPAGPAATVLVSLNGAASNLLVGTYTATLWWTNQNDVIGQSRQFSLSVISPPSITQQPTNQAVVEGALAAFSVQTKGGLPLAYQWQFNGTNLTDNGTVSGSTSASLTVGDVSAANVGTYTVVVTNFAATAVSSNAELSLLPSPPIITTQPASQAAFVGEDVQLLVTAIGTTPISYQWSLDTTNIDGATNATLVLNNVQLNQSGNYYSVLLTNVYGATNSATATVTVLPCDPTPAGLVSWWPAQGNANDIIGGNNGTLINGAGFGVGEVGSAFNLNGTNNFVLVSAGTNLNVGAGAGFTIEGWINPRSESPGIIAAYEGVLGGGTSALGVQFYANDGAPNLLCNMYDTGGGLHQFSTAAGILATGVWQHVALTYNKTSGVGVLYLNGTNVAQASLGSFTPQTSFTNLVIGARTVYASAAAPTDTFGGLIDELSIYNRALAANEITAIYQAGSGGKCSPAPAPPMISLQPTNETVAIGSAVVLAAMASGTSPLSYQWGCNGTNILEATNLVLTFVSVQLTNAGVFAVTVTNSYGAATSSNAVLTVIGVPPSITSPPVSEMVTVEATATFTVTAGGTPPLSFQWSFNGTNLVNATSAALILTNVQYSQAGNYAVWVTNLYGFAASSNAVLTVNPPSTCDPPPSGLVSWWPAQGNANDIISGNNGTLMNGAGFGVGEVGSAFSLNGTNNFVLVSAGTNLNVGAGAGFTIEGWINPRSQSPGIIAAYEGVLGGGSSALGVQFYANDGAPNLLCNMYDTGRSLHQFSSAAGILATGVWQQVALTYNKTSGVGVLYLNGTNVAQASLGSFTPQTSFTNLVIGARTVYASAAAPTDTFGGLIDELSIYNRALAASEITAIYQAGSAGKCPPSPPVIFSQPTNQAVAVGQNANFTVTATGTLPLNYQWRFNGTNMITVTNSLLTVLNVQATNLGNYSVLVTNAYGSALSSNALLTLLMPPTITLPPASSSNLAGSTATFGATASGASLNYQWQKSGLPLNNGGNVSGATTTGLILANVQDADAASYALVVTNLAGSVTSSPAILVVLDPPAILILLTNQLVRAGSNAVLVAAATGTAPVGCQWSFNGTNLWDTSRIQGSQTSVLVISNAMVHDTGNYQVVATNYLGSATSSVAVLTVGLPPQILSEPASKSAPLGCTISFSVGASGSKPLVEQWWKDGSLLSTQTNATLTVSNFQSVDLGSYSVVVTNWFGSITSSPAVLSVGYHPPLAGAVVVQRFASGGIRINVADLLANDLDTNGDSLTIVSVSSNSTAGGTVGLTNNWVYYAPPAGWTNSDTFTYTVSDGLCGTDVGTVLVQVTPDITRPTHFALGTQTNGPIQLIFTGIPGIQYQIQYSDSLGNPNWQVLAAQTSDSFGVCQFTDWSPTNTTTRYYRATAVADLPL